MREGNQIEKKIVGRFMYAMQICTKYNLLHKNVMRTITDNNLP